MSAQQASAKCWYIWIIDVPIPLRIRFEEFYDTDVAHSGYKLAVLIQGSYKVHAEFMRESCVKRLPLTGISACGQSHE